MRVPIFPACGGAEPAAAAAAGKEDGRPAAAPARTTSAVSQSPRSKQYLNMSLPKQSTLGGLQPPPWGEVKLGLKLPQVGLGRVVALCYHSSTSDQIG